MEHSDHQLYQVMLQQSWKGCEGDHTQDGMQRDQGSRLYEPKKVPLCVCLVLDCIGVSCWWCRHKNQSEAWHLEGWSRKMERFWPAKTVGLSVEIRLSHALSYFILCKTVSDCVLAWDTPFEANFDFVLKANSETGCRMGLHCGRHYKHQHLPGLLTRHRLINKLSLKVGRVPPIGYYGITGAY